MLPEFALEFGLPFSIGIIGAIAMLLWSATQYPTQRFSIWLDITIIASVCAIFFGRFLQVWFVNYRYYDVYPEDRLDIWYGGISWQGALFGGLAILLMLARWRKLDIVALSDGIALGLPLLMISGWWGCRGGGCGYSAIVTDDSPSPWLTSYLPDRFGDVWLRYEWQVLGMLLALLIWLIISSITLQDRLQGKRLGLTLILIGSTMLMLSIGRDDWLPTRLGNYGTRWLDLAVILSGVTWLIAVSRLGRSTMKLRTAEIGELTNAR